MNKLKYIVFKSKSYQNGGRLRDNYERVANYFLNEEGGIIWEIKKWNSPYKLLFETAANYLKYIINNHDMKSLFIQLLINDEIIVVDSLNVSLWDDHYSMITDQNSNPTTWYNNTFIKYLSSDLKPLYINFIQHIKNIRHNQQLAREGLQQTYETPEQQLNSTINICTLLKTVINNSSNKQGNPTFLIIHRSNRNLFYQSGQHYIMEITGTNIASEIDDVLVITAFKLISAITTLSEMPNKISIMSRDKYEWYPQETFGQLNRTLITYVDNQYKVNHNSTTLSIMRGSWQ